MFEEPHETGVGEPRGVRSLLKHAGLGDIQPVVVAGVCVLAMVAFLLVGWRFIGGAGQSGAEQDLLFEKSDGAGEGGEEVHAAEAPPQAEDSVPESVWIHVAGEVASPGLWELPYGARVGDAITVAGGPTPESVLDLVNLARPLSDGEQVYVPTREEALTGIVGREDGGSLAPGSDGTGGDSQIDLNTASENELVTLPGIGPATAAKIVTDRETNGPFSAPEDVMRVSGIGEKKFESIRDLIVVR